MKRLLRSIGRHVRCLLVSLTVGGARTTAYWAAFGLLRVNRFAILARDLRCPRPPVRDGGACELWTAERLARWRQDRPDLPTQFHQDRIDGVDLCAVAVEDGVVLGLIWIYRPEHYSRMFRLRPGEVELNQGFVLPQHRKRGLFTGVLDFACVEMARRGFHTAYAAVHEANGPSLGAFTGAGFLPRGAIRHVFLFRPAVSPPPLPDQDPTVANPAA